MNASVDDISSERQATAAAKLRAQLPRRRVNAISSHPVNAGTRSAPLCARHKSGTEQLRTAAAAAAAGPGGRAGGRTDGRTEGRDQNGPAIVTGLRWALQRALTLPMLPRRTFSRMPKSYQNTRWRLHPRTAVDVPIPPPRPLLSFSNVHLQHMSSSRQLLPLLLLLSSLLCSLLSALCAAYSLRPNT